MGVVFGGARSAKDIFDKGWGYATTKMAVAWRRARTPSLDSQRWRVLAINGQKYLIKALFDDQGYHVMISDLSTIWEEDPGAEKILRRGRVSVLL
jgi:hypothetical protein